MNTKWFCSILLCALLLGSVSACGSSTNSESPTLTPILPPPGSTPEPAREAFVNPLIYDTPEMYQVKYSPIYELRS